MGLIAGISVAAICVAVQLLGQVGSGGLATRYRSLGCSERSEALAGLHASFDGSMVLRQDIVPILHWA